MNHKTPEKRLINAQEFRALKFKHNTIKCLRPLLVHKKLFDPDWKIWNLTFSLRIQYYNENKLMITEKSTNATISNT